MPRISQLPTTTAVGSTDLVPVVQSGVTKSVKTSDLATTMPVRAAGTTTSRTLGDHLGVIPALENFGAIGNGVADDTEALNRAASSGGLVLLKPGKTYRVTGPIVFGNGTNTSISSVNCTRWLSGAAATGSEITTPTQATKILYDGPVSATSAVLKVAGPVTGVEINGLLIDANGRAGYGVEVAHAYGCRFANMAIQRYTSRGLYVRTISGPLFSGITQGCKDNIFERIICSNITSTTSVGLYLAGHEPDNVGCSRNTFIGCRFAAGGATEQAASIVIEYADNNFFSECFTFPGTSSVSGKGVYFVPASNTLFPHENVFLNCPVVGGVGGTGGTGGNVFWPYPTSDGETIPDANKYRFLTHTGLLGGVNVLYLGAGTAAQPSLTFNPDQDTGLYSAGSDALGFSVGGAQRLALSAASLTFNVTADLAGNPIVNASTAEIESVFPRLWFVSSGAGADEKRWRAVVDGSGVFSLATRTDADGAGNTAIEVKRTGTDVTEIGLFATTVRFGTYTTSADVACNGYITIKDASGNTRKLMTTA